MRGGAAPALAGDPEGELLDGLDNDCNGMADDVDLYALSVEVRAPTGSAQGSYIQVVDRSMWDGQLITNASALEFTGIARLLTMAGHTFIGPRTEPTLNRYVVGDDRSLTLDRSLGTGPYARATSISTSSRSAPPRPSTSPDPPRPA